MSSEIEQAAKDHTPTIEELLAMMRQVNEEHWQISKPWYDRKPMSSEIEAKQKTMAALLRESLIRIRDHEKTCTYQGDGCRIAMAKEADTALNILEGMDVVAKAKGGKR